MLAFTCLVKTKVGILIPYGSTHWVEFLFHSHGLDDSEAHSDECWYSSSFHCVVTFVFIGIRCTECWRLSSVSANIVIGIFRVNDLEVLAALIYISPPPPKTLTLKRATAVFAKTEILQHSTPSARSRLGLAVKMTFVFRGTWCDVNWRMFLTGFHSSHKIMLG
jgi:hypothetical protein